MKNTDIKFKNNRGSIKNPLFDNKDNEKKLKNYGITPLSIATDDRISAVTKNILFYFCIKSGIGKNGDCNNWIPTVEDIKNRFHLDDRKWFKCRDELRNIKVIPFDHPVRVEGGGGDGKKYVWTFDVDLTQFFEFELSTVSTTDQKNHPANSQDGNNSQAVDFKQKNELSTEKLNREPKMELSTEKNRNNTNLQGGNHPADLQKFHPANPKDNELMNKKEELKKEEDVNFTSLTVRKMKQNVIKKPVSNFTSSQFLH